MNKFIKFFIFILFFIIISFPLITFGKNKIMTKKINKDLDKNVSINSIEKDQKYKKNEVIVKYKKDKIKLTEKNEKLKAKEFEEINEVESVKEILELNIKLLKSKDNKKTTEELISELEKDSNIEYVEPNYIFKPTVYNPNDTYFSSQWALNNTGQTGGETTDADIDAPEAWDNENDSNKIVVAVIDTGVRYTHEDLINNMWDGSAGCNDENNNPIVGGCPNHGWDFQYEDNDPMDDYGHGTFVSGIIAGESNNGKGISGVSRYNDIEIMAIKVGDGDGFSIFDIIQGINFANNNGADIINASYGGYGYSTLQKDAIDNFSGIFVAAAGNDDNDNDGDYSMYPCSYDSDSIICVAATDDDDWITWFSNYGLNSVDIAAPGYDIYSANYSSDTSYGSNSGTSFATPYVTGATALAIKQFPSKSLNEIKNLIIESGDTLNYLDEYVYKGKRLNLYNLLNNSIPPVISNEYPDDDSFPANTKEITITLNTDKNATCKYSITAGIDYDSIPNTFSSTGGTSHSTVITGITLDNYYEYYVRCSDNSGNKNYSDFLVEFETEDGLTNLYRFWSDQNQGHFYTASEEEKRSVMDNYPDNVWRYEDIAYEVFNVQISGTTPVYRFWSDQNQGHFYTASQSERDYVINNYDDSVWRYEGVAYYVYSTQQSGTKPVYRFWSDQNQHHFYTASQSERDYVINNYDDSVWRYEGEAWWVIN